MQEELKEAIEKSGNRLHLEVVKILEDNHWEVDLSSYYYDDTERKPREIDIVANRSFPVQCEGREVSRFKLFLFVECKYFQNELAFRMRKNNKDDAQEAIIVEGIEKTKDLFSYLRGELDRSSHPFIHHYLRDERVGKLYDVVTEKDGKKSADNKEVFKALTQPIKSLIFFHESLFKMEIEKGITKAVYYPVVVYSNIDGIYPVVGDDTESLDGLQPKEELLYSLNYSYESPVKKTYRYAGVPVPELTTHQFYISFVSKEVLSDFLRNTVHEEAERFQRYLSRLAEEDLFAARIPSPPRTP